MAIVCMHVFDISFIIIVKKVETDDYYGECSPDR